MYARDNVAAASRRLQPDDGQFEAAVVMLRMLADPTRLRLMWLLASGEYDVTALTEAVTAHRPAVSQHLGKLRLAGLVATRREGRRVFYTASDEHVRRLVTEVLYAAEHQVLDQPPHHHR